MDRLQVDFTAIQRFERLTEQRETICRREAVIVDETKVVEDLLKDIDEQKREKTEFTLRQIGKYFEENFKILAPDGSKGELQKRVTQRPGLDAGKECHAHCTVYHAFCLITLVLERCLHEIPQ